MFRRGSALPVILAAGGLIVSAPNAADDSTVLPSVSAAPERLLFVDHGSYRDTVRLALLMHEGPLNVHRLRFTSETDALLQRCQPQAARVVLSPAQGAWIAPRFGRAQRTVILGALADRGARPKRRVLHASALLAILDGVELACARNGVPSVAAEFAVDALTPLSQPTSDGVLEIRLSVTNQQLS